VKPFFAHHGAVLGYRTAGGLRLLRLRDGRSLDLRGSAHDDHCDIFAFDPDGGFEGQPHGALGFRMGNDLRRSEVVVSGPTFEARRRSDLAAALFADE
jgi:hypothetical protein